MASPRCTRRTRRDRLSTSVLPEHPHAAESQTPYLHRLLGEADAQSRLFEDHVDDRDERTDYSDADAVVIQEVAAWLELREQNRLWARQRKYAEQASLLRAGQRCA